MFRSSSPSPSVSVNVNMNPVRGDREDEKRMLPCRYFVAGFCHRGSRCKFFHPNMHGRDPVIRVPDLPSDFTLVPQCTPYEGSHGSSGITSLLDMSPSQRGLRPNRRMKTTLASPINSSPPRRSSMRDSYRGFMSPSSNAYAEYMTYSQFRGPMRRDEDMDEFSDSADELKPPAQNTVFNHIDWSEFLTPGVRPPPPTNVPEQASSIISPARVLNSYKEDYVRYSPLSTKSYNKDMPPEGYQTREDEQELLEIIEMLDGNKPKKLSAKEELQMKVKQIAKELADEPAPQTTQTRSVDSFFQDDKVINASSGKINTTPVKVSKVEEDKENENMQKEKTDDEPIETATTTATTPDTTATPAVEA